MIIERDEVGSKKFLRSKGNFDVKTFARRYFDGGGILTQAGGRQPRYRRRPLQRFIAALKENSSQLQITKQGMKPSRYVCFAPPVFGESNLRRQTPFNVVGLRLGVSLSCWERFSLH